MLTLDRADLLSLMLCAEARAEDLAITIANLAADGRPYAALELSQQEARRVAAKARAVLMEDRHA